MKLWRNHFREWLMCFSCIGDAKEVIDDERI